jgi:hypothetical protein
VRHFDRFDAYYNANWLRGMHLLGVGDEDKPKMKLLWPVNRTVTAMIAP